MSNHNKVKAILLSTVIAISLLISACLAGCSTPKDTSATNTQTQETQTDSSNTEKPPVESDTNTDKPADSEVDTNTDTSTPVTPDVPVEPENTTFEEFMSEHITIANQFALDQIEQISYSDKSLSTSYSFVANENNLEKIIVAQVVAGEGETRELKIAQISFAGGADFDDILSQEDFVPVITNETVLAFDAKEEFLKGDSSTIEDQIADKIAENLGEDAIEIEKYKAETFAPTTVKELVDECGIEINQKLNDECLKTMMKQCIPIGYNAENIVDGKWFVDGDKKITSISYVSNYKQSDTSYWLCAINYVLEEPIDIDKVFSTSIFMDSSKLTAYSFNYVPTIQGTRDEIMNAIFKANGMSETCPEGAIRLIKVGSSGPDELGYQCTGFTVVEIGNDKISEISIAVKLSSTDAQYITNIQNGYYRFYGEKSADIAGEEVEYVAIAVEDANGLQ
ncbi:MAG: hypothetical protein IJD89_07470 [Clostridia bacterium]|nr:hypothetical protein [Clostridia bacterium]